MRFRKIIICFIFICYSLFAICSPALAGFNPDYLLSDKELTNHQSMTLEEIKEFLNRYDGALKNYQTRDLDGRFKSAAEIIYNASQYYRVNPQVLITLLQKEQTLVTKKTEKPTQYEWATGFGAYDGRKPVERFRGFSRQVDRAAWRLRYFVEHPWEFRFRSGQIYQISRTLVMPQNLATAALYNYTPHLRGNQLFWTIWQRWFGGKTGKLENGTLVRTRNEQGVWLIQNDKRRPFFSKNVFLASYSFKNVRLISPQDLNQYEIGEPMNFPNYSLLQTPGQTIYLIVDREVRSLSQSIFRQIGFHPEEIIKVDEGDLKQYNLGRPITSPYPTGALLQDSVNGAVYYVKDDYKYPLWSKEILKVNFPYQKIIQVQSEKLLNFHLGEPLKFRDGTLIKESSSPTVYLISQGQKKPIVSEEVFAEFGYQWENIITVPENILNLHEIGEPIILVNGTQTNND